MSPKKTEAELLEARAQRQAEAEEARKRTALQELELEDEFSGKLGRRGEDFEIIVTPKGCIVIKKPDYVTVKKWTAIPPGKTTEEDAVAFVNPCIVYPESAIVRPLFAEHAAFVWRCATACAQLSNLTALEREGKF